MDFETTGSACDDVVIECGTFVDTGEESSEDVLNTLQDQYAGEIEQEWLEQQIGAAEAFYEGDR